MLLMSPLFIYMWCFAKILVTVRKIPAFT